jgi:hypothetical protein
MLNYLSVIFFTLLIVVGFESCQFLAEKQQESDEAIEGTSLTEQIKEAQIEPKNHEVFKHLIQMKNLLPKPVEIPARTVERENPMRSGEQVVLDPCYDNPERKEVINACDFTSSTVRNTSIQIASNNPGNYNIGQLCDLFDFALKRWTYINDPIMFDYVAKASETIEQNYTGDCDDFAVLLASMIMSIGGDIRLNYAYNDSSGHAFVEANLGRINLAETKTYLRQRYDLGKSGVIYVRRDDRSQNIWLNMDWFAKHPGGPYFGHDRGIRFFIAYRHCESFVIDSLGRIQTYKN